MTKQFRTLSLMTMGICNYCERDVELNKEYPVGEEGWKNLK